MHARLRCDAPGCASVVYGDGPSDLVAHTAVEANAVHHGWQVARDRLYPERDIGKDYCPFHRQPEAAPCP